MTNDICIAQKAFEANFSTLKRALLNQSLLFSEDSKSDFHCIKERNRTLSHSLLIEKVSVSVAAPLVAVQVYTVPLNSNPDGRERVELFETIPPPVHLICGGSGLPSAAQVTVRPALGQ